MGETVIVVGATGVVGRRAALVPALRTLRRSVRASNRRLRAASGSAPRVHAGTDGWHRIAAGDR